MKFLFKKQQTGQEKKIPEYFLSIFIIHNIPEPNFYENRCRIENV
jgi:hypothetical protein